MSTAALRAVPSVPSGVTEVTSRLVRCHVLSRHRNPCKNPAVDPDAKTPVCVRHLTEICQDAVRLIGRQKFDMITGDGDSA